MKRAKLHKGPQAQCPKCAAEVTKLGLEEAFAQLAREGKRKRKEEYVYVRNDD